MQYVLSAYCGVTRGKNPFLGKYSEENLEKDSPYVLLVIPGDEGLHSMSPQVVVELVQPCMVPRYRRIRRSQSNEL